MSFRIFSGLTAALLISVAATSAQAADVEAPLPELWSGFYLGAQAGYLQGTGSDTDLCIKTNVDGGPEGGCLGDGGFGIPGFDIGDNDMDGVTAGGYVGYNYRVDAVVLGLEGDFNWDNAKGNNSILGELNYDTSINWDASIRARLGVVVDERALLYITGGPSWLSTELNSNLCALAGGEGLGANTSCGDDSTKFGWQLGAGAEYAMTEHLSIKAEYLHGWYGDTDLDIAKLSDGDQYIKYQLKQNLQTNVVRVGVAYHFGGL